MEENADSDIAQIVAEDLQHLQTEHHGDVSDASLRRNSAVLRRLLIDNDLIKAWRLIAVEGKPLITFLTTDDIVGRIPRRLVRFAHAGYAEKSDIGIACTYILKDALQPSEIKKYLSQVKMPNPNCEPPWRTMSLKNFSKSTIAIVESVEISREELVKYVSNKLGGAHLDPKRSVSSLEKKYRMLDGFRASLLIAERSSIYFLFLSIVRDLANSECCLRYLDHCRKLGIIEK